MAKAARGRRVGASTGTVIGGRPNTETPEDDTPAHRELEKRMRLAEQREAAQNLQALHRPLKPPARRSP